MKGELGELFLAVADDDGVHERSDRFGVRRGRPAGDDERVVLAAIDGAKRDLAEVQDREAVGVGELVLQRETDDVEVRERTRALEGDER